LFNQLLPISCAALVRLEKSNWNVRRNVDKANLIENFEQPVMCAERLHVDDVVAKSNDEAVNLSKLA